eukprot:gene9945-20677_t
MPLAAPDSLNSFNTYIESSFNFINTESIQSVDYVLGQSNLFLRQDTLLSLDEAVVEDNLKVLYVHQGEIATNISENSFDYVGSDDATTCHIFFVKSRTSGRMMLSHIDNKEFCEKVLDVMEDLDNFTAEDSTSLVPREADVYIVGGIDDEQSKEISDALLQGMIRSSIICYLQLFCTCKLNTIVKDNEMWPRVIGCSFSPSVCSPSKNSHHMNESSTVSTCPIIPLYFPRRYREPGYLLRRCRGFSSTTTSSTASTVVHRVEPVYDGLRRNVFHIPYFEVNMRTAVVDYLLSLSDKELLAQTSTSPAVEPRHFVEDMRECLVFVRDPTNVRKAFSRDGQRKGHGHTTVGRSISSDLKFALTEQGIWQQLLEV